MAIIIREPRNPLADALSALSQQILADAASRKEREFRSQEIAKERAFMSGENALQREYLTSQNAENRAARAMEYASGLAQERELGLARETTLRQQSSDALAAAQASAGAQSAGALAQAELLRLELEGRAARTNTMLGLLATLRGYNYDPKSGTFAKAPKKYTGVGSLEFGGEMSPELKAATSRGLIPVPENIRIAAKDYDIKLKPFATQEEIDSAVTAVEKSNVGFFGRFMDAAKTHVPAGAVAGGLVSAAPTLGIGTIPGALLGGAAGAVTSLGQAAFGTDDQSMAELLERLSRDATARQLQLAAESDAAAANRDFATTVSGILQ